MSAAIAWLSVTHGEAPLIVSMPHTGIEISADLAPRFVSPWLAGKDADWWIERVYDFAPALDATVIRTTLSRSVIDVNRDPSGRSLYPGQNTTELCPTTTFDGEPLYREGSIPDDEEIARRRLLFFEPYHSALKVEISRLNERHPKIVLFEAHSIRSRIPRLFGGELPHFNIGTNGGASCARELTSGIQNICASSPAFTHITNGRFKGGYTTRHYGDPASGVHAVQLELAMRAYMDEPDVLTPDSWPSPFDAARAARMRDILRRILETCLSFASSS
ncbi:MAG: N-formylglutamate deformylase [Rhizomicrobium sp.]